MLVNNLPRFLHRPDNFGKLMPVLAASETLHHTLAENYPKFHDNYIQAYKGGAAV